MTAQEGSYMSWPYRYCHIVYNCDTNLDLPGKRESQLKNWLHHIGWWAGESCIFLSAQWCERAQPHMDNTILSRWTGMYTKGCPKTKPVSTTPVWFPFRSLRLGDSLGFPQKCTEKFKIKETFSALSCFWSWVFIIVIQI